MSKQTWLLGADARHVPKPPRFARTQESLAAAVVKYAIKYCRGAILDAIDEYNLPPLAEVALTGCVDTGDTVLYTTPIHPP